LNLIPISLVLLFAANAVAQAPKSAQPPTVERICGKLEHTETIPVKGDPHTLVEKVRNLRHVSISLFPADENRQCCEGANAIATTVTGHWGGFEMKLKRVPSGLYWLQVEPDGQKYRMIIRYAPKRYSDQLCTQTYWAIDNAGNFREGQFITID
jgi:hypothetical protein